MAEAKLYGQNKGGMSINGIIKDYYAYAGENISAGDLVEYVNGIAGKADYGESAETQLDGEINTGWQITTVQLDNNRVFVAHASGTSTSNMDIHAMIITVNGNSIEVGQDVTIISSVFSGEVLSSCKLLDNRVLIAYSYSTYHNLYAIVCEVEGNEIKYGENTALSTVQYSGYEISPVTLENGDVFIAHRTSSYSYLYAMVVTVNGKTIEIGEDTKLIDARYEGTSISACLVGNGNVFVAHSHGNSMHLYGMIVTISDKTITPGNDIKLDDTNPTGGLLLSTCTLPNGDVFISYGAHGVEYYLYAIVCTISGTNITIKTQKQLSNESDSGYATNPLILPNGNIFLVHSKGSYLYGMIVEVGDTIITGEDVLLNGVIATGKRISSVLMQNGNACVVHSHSSNKYYLYAQIFGIDYENNIPTKHIIATDYETQVRKVTTGQFDGIAKTSGAGGDDTGHNDLVSIWTKEPTVTQEFTTADGNTLYDANGDIFLVVA